MLKGIIKSRIAIFAVLVLVAAVLLRGRKSTPIDATLRRQPCTLAHGIHLLGRLAPAAAYVVETSDGLALIDTGQDPDCASLREQMRALKLDVSKLRAIFLTHAHADHSMGARLLRKLTGAKIHAGRGDADVLRRGAPREAFTSFFAMPDIKLHATEVDVVLAGDEVIHLGDAQFTAISAPGHSPGSMCYLLKKDGLRALFTGDVVLSLTDTARFGGIGTKGTYYSPRYRADAGDFLATLERLRGIPPPDLVLPGHPQLDKVPQNARFTDAQWHAHLDRGIREMRTLVQRYRADGKIHLDGTAREILAGLHYFGDFQGTAMYGLAVSKEVFIFDAPGGHGLAEFVRAAMRRARIDLSHPMTVLLTSCDPEATDGLKDLVDATGCKVVVPKEGRSTLPALGPRAHIINLEELPAWSRSFPGQAVPLKGRGQSPTAYQLSIDDKTVLISGRFLTRGTGAEWNEFMRLVGQRRGNPKECLWSLGRVRPIRPHVWLPSASQFGANALLYDNDWNEILDLNEIFLRQLVAAFDPTSR